MLPIHITGQRFDIAQWRQQARHHPRSVRYELPVSHHADESIGFNLTPAHTFYEREKIQTMKSISTLLERFKKQFSDTTEINSNIIQTISKYTGIMLDEKEISISGKTLSIKAKPHIRGEIFIKKEKILAELQKIVGDKIREIR